MILTHMRNISEYKKRVLTLLYGWAKLCKFWKKETFKKEVDFPEIQSCLEQDQLEEKQQRWSYNSPTCDFGIEHVKEENDDVTATSFLNSTALSLLGSLDPYWESQLLVEYSKNLFTCKVLDGKMEDRRYKVVDGVIYFHDIFG